eukprot:7056027-Lingulodinium_polyedra.AAC.1
MRLSSSSPSSPAPSPSSCLSPPPPPVPSIVCPRTLRARPACPWQGAPHGVLRRRRRGHA